MHTRDLHLILPCATQGAGHAERHTTTSTADRAGPPGTTQPGTAEVWDAGRGMPEGPVVQPGCLRRCPRSCPPHRTAAPTGSAPSAGLRGLQPRGAGLRSPEGRLRWELGQAAGLGSASQTPKCVKRLLPPRKGFKKCPACGGAFTMAHRSRLPCTGPPKTLCCLSFLTRRFSQRPRSTPGPLPPPPTLVI